MTDFYETEASRLKAISSLAKVKEAEKRAGKIPFRVNSSLVLLIRKTDDPMRVIKMMHLEEEYKK